MRETSVCLFLYFSLYAMLLFLLFNERALPWVKGSPACPRASALTAAAAHPLAAFHCLNTALHALK